MWEIRVLMSVLIDRCTESWRLTGAPIKRMYVELGACMHLYRLYHSPDHREPSQTALHTELCNMQDTNMHTQKIHSSTTNLCSFLPQRKGRGTDSGCRRRAPRGSTTACMHRRSSATAVPHTSAHNISRKMNELNTRIIMIVMSNLARKTKFDQFAA